MGSKLVPTKPVGLKSLHYVRTNKLYKLHIIVDSFMVHMRT